MIRALPPQTGAVGCPCHLPSTPRPHPRPLSWASRSPAPAGQASRARQGAELIFHATSFKPSPKCLRSHVPALPQGKLACDIPPGLSRVHGTEQRGLAGTGPCSEASHQGPHRTGVTLVAEEEKQEEDWTEGGSCGSAAPPPAPAVAARPA